MSLDNRGLILTVYQADLFGRFQQNDCMIFKKWEHSLDSDPSVQGVLYKLLFVQMSCLFASYKSLQLLPISLQRSINSREDLFTCDCVVSF